MVGFGRVCANAGIVSRGRRYATRNSDVQIARYLQWRRRHRGCDLQPAVTRAGLVDASKIVRWPYQQAMRFAYWLRSRGRALRAWSFVALPGCDEPLHDLFRICLGVANGCIRLWRLVARNIALVNPPARLCSEKDACVRRCNTACMSAAGGADVARRTPRHDRGIAPDRSNQPFSMSILPWRSRRRWSFTYAHQRTRRVKTSP